MPSPPENLELRGRVIRLLKERGPADPELHEALQEWETEQERIADQDPTADGRIHHCIARAEMYGEAGYTEAALENLLDASDQAWQEERDELYTEILEKINRIKKEGEGNAA